jgi:hypothetical protein
VEWNNDSAKFKNIFQRIGANAAEMMGKKGEIRNTASEK